MIAVDHSFSMRAADHLARAKDEASNVSPSLKPGDQAQVIALGGRCRRLTQLDLRSRRTARRRRFHSAGRQPRVLRRTGPLRAHAVRIHTAAARSAPGQRSAKDPPCRRDSPICAWIPGPPWSFIRSASRPPNWTVENVIAPAAYLRSEESPRAGDHRQLRRRPAARRRARNTVAQTRHRHPWSYQRQGAANQNRRCSRERPGASRISRPRRALRIQPRRSAHRFGRRLARRRPFLFRGRAHRSPQSSVRRRRPPAATRSCISAPRSIPPAMPHSKSSRTPGTGGAISSSRIMRSSCCRIVGSLPPGFEDSLKTLRERRRLGAGRSRTGLGRACRRVPVLDEPFEAAATPAAKASASSPSPKSTSATPPCAAWSDSPA